MRKYYILTADDRQDVELVCDYELGDFDCRLLWTGERFSGRIPSCVRLWVERGVPCDYLSNPISWLIVSDRFWELIRSDVRRDVQVLSPPLYYEDTKERVRGYKLLNPLRCVRTAWQESDLIGTNRRVYLDLIPEDAHFFRDAHYTTRILISEYLVSKLRGKGLVGVALIKTTAVRKNTRARTPRHKK